MNPEHLIFPPPNWVGDIDDWSGPEHGWLTPSGWWDTVDPSRFGQDCSEDGRASDGSQAVLFDYAAALSAWMAAPATCAIWYAHAAKAIATEDAIQATKEEPFGPELDPLVKRVMVAHGHAYNLSLDLDSFYQEVVDGSDVWHTLVDAATTAEQVIVALADAYESMGGDPELLAGAEEEVDDLDTEERILQSEEFEPHDCGGFDDDTGETYTQDDCDDPNGELDESTDSHRRGGE